MATRKQFHFFRTLNDNGMLDIYGQMFTSGSTVVTDVDLSNNMLTTLPVETFIGLTSGEM